MNRLRLELHVARWSCVNCRHFRGGKKPQQRGCTSDYSKCRAGLPIREVPRLFWEKAQR